MVPQRDSNKEKSMGFRMILGRLGHITSVGNTRFWVEEENGMNNKKPGMLNGTLHSMLT
jgi:hypothetical protein